MLFSPLVCIYKMRNINNIYAFCSWLSFNKENPIYYFSALDSLFLSQTCNFLGERNSPSCLPSFQDLFLLFQTWISSTRFASRVIRLNIFFQYFYLSRLLNRRIKRLYLYKICKWKGLAWGKRNKKLAKEIIVTQVTLLYPDVLWIKHLVWLFIYPKKFGKKLDLLESFFSPLTLVSRDSPCVIRL